MVNNKEIKFFSSKHALTKLAAAVIIVILVAAFSFVAGGAYYILAVVRSNQQNNTIPTPNPINTPTPTDTITPNPTTPTPPPTTPTTCPPTSNPTTTTTNQPPPTQPPQPTPTHTPPPTPTPYPTYTFSDAVSAGIIEANITGWGASSGNSIIVNMRRLVDTTVEIEPLATGTLITTSSSAQNMAVLWLTGKISSISNYSIWYNPTSRMILDSSNVTQYFYAAFCVNLHRGNPQFSSLYTVNGTADPNVVKILNVVVSNQLPSNVTTTAAIQTAISVVTDNPTRTELLSVWSTFAPDIPNAKTILDTAGIDTTNANLFK